MNTAPRVRHGPLSFTVQWCDDPGIKPRDIEVQFFEPSSAHYDEAMRRVGLMGILAADNPMTSKLLQEALDRKLLETCITRIGDDEMLDYKAQTKYWAEAPETFRFLVHERFNKECLLRFMAVKNYLLRSGKPSAGSQQPLAEKQSQSPPSSP